VSAGGLPKRVGDGGGHRRHALGARWRRGETREVGGEGVRPGPAALQAQRVLAGMAGKDGDGAQQPVAQRLGFAGREFAVERRSLTLELRDARTAKDASDA
jgi:hypothetical protein